MTADVVATIDPAIPRVSMAEYLELLAGGGLHHLCARCGRCDLSGGWCSWGRTAPDQSRRPGPVCD